MSALVSALLTEVKQSNFGNDQDRKNTEGKLISRLLLSDWNDSVEHITPILLGMIGHAEVSEKLQGWRLLPILLRSQYRRHIFVVKPLCQFIDKQSFVYNITAAKQYSTVLKNAICEGINSILALSLDVNEVSTSIEAQLVRIIGSSLDLMKDPSTGTTTALFAMNVMTSVSTAKGRLFTPQNLNKLISTSFQLLSDAHLSTTAARLLAVCVSHGSCDLYESIWKCLSNGKQNISYELIINYYSLSY